MHLDPVGTDLDLPAHLGHDFVFALHHLHVAGDSGIGDEAAGGSAQARDQRITAAGDTWAFNDAGFNRIAHVDHVLEDRIRIEDAGDAGAQQLARVVRRHQCRQRVAAQGEDLRVGRRVVERQVHMGVDQPRHHGHACHVEPLQSAGVARPLDGLRTDRGNLVRFDQHRSDKR